MRYLTCFLFNFIFFYSFGQGAIVQKMSWYAKARPTSSLFIHFDKNIYSNNETIYFTGFLLKSKLSPINSHRILSISLIRSIDTTLITTVKFVMANGLSFGNLTIPDSIQTGNYRLVAHTDRLVNDLPEVTFIQQLTIKTNFEPPFKASIKIAQLATAEDKMHRLLFTATTNDNRFLPQPIQISYRYGSLRRKAKTDASGQVLMALPLQSQISDPNVYVKLISEKDTSYITMGLPLGKNKASVRFFPEGGYCVKGLRNNIGWEVKDQQEMPLALKAFLYKNDKVIDTIETGTYGIGNFMLFHETDANYSIKLIHDGLVDSIYQLPKPIDNGITLHLPEAVCSDTLTLKLYTNSLMKLTIRLHNFRETFIAVPFTMDASKKSIKISLAEIPIGLTTLTITDSLDRPLAERMIFAHYKKDPKIKITTDKQIYHQREEVSLKLLATQPTGEALVSIAIVQENRFDPKKTNDIESYYYLKTELADLPLNLKGQSIRDQDYLEQVLLVKGWRKYTWQGLVETKQSDTLAKIDSLTMTGMVLRRDKELTAPITLTTLGSNNLQMVSTTKTGLFDFNVPELLSPAGSKTYILVADKNRTAFQIKINDAFTEVAKKIKKLDEEIQVLPSTLANNAELIIKGNEKSVRLKEVVIKAGNTDNSFNHSMGLPGANPCGDYVCEYRVFNCRNHAAGPTSTQPVKGQRYGGLPYPYMGCVVFESTNQEYVKFNGIHTAKEFYKNDYKDPGEPAFFSTIYWNYAVLLEKNKTTELKFFTSDITGKFKIVAQGITGADVVYATATFEVKPK